MPTARADRLYQRADAARWKLPLEIFSNALERSAEKAFAGRSPTEAELNRYYDSLHLKDLALACACAMGKDAAWDHFVTEFRPAMYRAADAMDASGAAREIADALYAELFGLREKDGIRQSVFRYFHGRSSMATWLRSVVAQRFIDRHRETRRLDPLPDESSPRPLAAPQAHADPDQARYVSALRAALTAAVAALAPRDRLRLACYYAQQMTLAQIARLTREHEATVSRQLARTRKDLRAGIERHLREASGFSPREAEECVAAVIQDSGDLDLNQWFSEERSRAEALAKERKNSPGDRSKSEDVS